MARVVRTASVVAAALAVLLVAAAMVAMVVAARAPAAGPAAGLSSRPAGEHDFRGARDLGSAATTPAVSLSVRSGITTNGRLGGP
jgi:hypothetical protein